MISFSIMALLVIRWKIILSAVGKDVTFIKLFSYKLAAFAVAYLTPTRHAGGEPTRAYILKKEGIEMPKALSSVMLDIFFSFSSDAIFTLTGFIVLVTYFTISRKAEIIILIALFFAFFLITRFVYNNMVGRGTISSAIEFFSADKIRFVNKIKRKIKKIERHNIKFFRRHKEEVLITFLISCLLWILMFLEYWFALNIVGYTPTLMQIFLILTFVAIAYLIPVPAAIGVLEATQISIFSILGIKLSTAIALSFLIRARDLLWSAIGIGSIYTHGISFIKAYMKNE